MKPPKSIRWPGFLSEESALITQRPFRAPHHTISPVGLSGGGSIPRLRNFSGLQRGTVLDELPEFSRDAMEVLRQPMEDGQVTISRIAGTLTYPCAMMVVAAMNPCPCGYFGHPVRSAAALPERSAAIWLSIRLLLDRLDLHVEVAPVEYQNLVSTRPEESSAAIRSRVNQALKFSRSGISLSASPAMPSFPPRRSIALPSGRQGYPPCCPGRLKPWGFLPGLMTAFKSIPHHRRSG